MSVLGFDGFMSKTKAKLVLAYPLLPFGTIREATTHLSTFGIYRHANLTRKNQKSLNFR